MKIAHFAQFAPHACGQYETVRDLIKAERMVGIEAEFIDYGKKDLTCQVGKKDGHITTAHPDYAKQADVLFHHTAIPQSISKNGKPIVLCLHGRPESTLKIGLSNGGDLIKAILNFAKDDQYKAILTFWYEYLFLWENIISQKEKLFCIPAPVDLERFNFSIKKRILPKEGRPRLMIADLWREDITPFNSIFAAIYYKQNFQPSTTIHLFGLPSQKNRLFLEDMRVKGMFASFYPSVIGLEKIYPKMDLLITPHSIAVRTVREALACGLPIVAGTGNKYTNFRENSNDIYCFANEISRAWKFVEKDEDDFRLGARRTAEKEFDPIMVGNKIKTLLAEVLK